MLIERGDQLAALRVKAGEGTARVVLVEGPAGMGKTALLDDAIAEASAAGAAVLQASSIGWGFAPPWGVVARLGASPDGGAQASLSTETDVVESFSQLVQSRAERSPVVIAVDDAHRIDVESFDCIVYAARQLPSANVLVVLTELSTVPLQPSLMRSELIRLPSFRALQVGPLSLPGVSRLIAAELPQLDGAKTARRWHALSGGNPLLLRGLVEDYRMWASGWIHRSELPAGPVFRQAVVACLRRTGPVVNDVAAGVALLADRATPGLLAQLLGLPTTVVARALDALRSIRILRGRNFRHPGMVGAVLDDLAPERRADLHGRAATLLHSGGAPPTAIATHIRAWTGADGGWQITVLRQAAQQMLVEDRSVEAVELLELALRLSRDPSQQLAITLDLAAASRRTSLPGAEQLLSEPLAAMRDGRLPVEILGALASQLVAQGRVDEAREVSRRLPLEPAVLQVPRLTPAGALSALLTPAPAPDATVTFCEDIAGVSPLTDATIDTLVAAIRTLRTHGQPDLAVEWSRSLATEAASRRIPGWEALFLSELAACLLRVGDLEAAEQAALAAFSHVPDAERCVFVRAPLATLVHVYLLVGRIDEAQRHLGQSVTGMNLESEQGLLYRRARGHCYLATGRVHAALSDFLHVGQVVGRWALDDASMPWRSDVAEALQLLGASTQADEVLAEELDGTAAKNPWNRGIALRLRARITSPPDERVGVLLDAIGALEGASAPVELALTLADLAEVYRELGHRAASRNASRRARALAEQCGAMSIVHCLNGRGAPSRRRSEIAAAQPDVIDRLTDSEKRVATLAARGETNRRIAQMLYITTSTVEQHLTSVYRKLDISGRQDLPLPVQEGPAPRRRRGT